MARKKMIAYVDKDLLRSAKILAAKRDGKIYEVFEEALRSYLEEAGGSAFRRQGPDARRAVRGRALSSLALDADPG